MRFLYKNNRWPVNKEYNIDKLLYLMIDRPDEFSYGDNNSLVWLNKKKQFNRNYDLPSYIYIFIDEICFNLYWYKNSKLHREKSKAAIIYSNGDKSYYLNGNYIKDNQNEISLFK